MNWNLKTNEPSYNIPVIKLNHGMLIGYTYYNSSVILYSLSQNNRGRIIVKSVSIEFVLELRNILNNFDEETIDQLFHEYMEIYIETNLCEMINIFNCLGY